MTALVQINQGTAPAGSDGDTVRSAFTKVNANTAALNAQATLTSAAATVTTAQSLTAALHLGHRVNINLSSAGTVNLPAASTCGADGIIHLRNTGTTVVTVGVTSGSGDTDNLSNLNPGESVVMDTDGVHTWTVLMRGRTNSDNETVNGNCTVNGNETIVGALTASSGMFKGATTIDGSATINNVLAFTKNGSQRFNLFNTTDPESGSNAGSNIILNAFSDTGTFIGNVCTIVRSSQQIQMNQRPTFAGKTPWDNGNLVNPATTDTTQTITGFKTWTTKAFFSAQAASVNASDSQVVVTGGTGAGRIGFFGPNNTLSVQARCGSSSAAMEVVSTDSSAYAPVNASAFNQLSDARLKSNVTTIDNALDKLRQFRGVYYTMHGVKSVGVIAQEAQKPFPEVVTEIIPDDESGDVYLGVNYANLVGPLLQGILETDLLISCLTRRIEALEAK